MSNDVTISSETIIRWLMIEGPRLEAPSALLNGYSLKLREAGIQVDRSTLGAPILHPIAKSSYVFWDNKTGPEQRWFVYTPDQMEMLKASPIQKIYTHGEPTSLRLDLPATGAVTRSVRISGRRATTNTKRCPCNSPTAHSRF